MKPNRFRQVVREGRIPLGTMVWEFGTRGMAKILESADIDFVLIDIWVEMARPALELIAPRLRPGAIVCADNVIMAAPAYGPYFEFIRDPANGFLTMTLPFEGGFEMSVKVR